MLGVTFFILISLSLGYSSDIDDLIQPKPSKGIPIVLWHGMGDCCCNPLSLGRIKKFLEEKIPGVYVKSIMIGNNVIEDTENGYFKNANKQVQMVCDQLAADPKMANGYNAIGFSQGAQFLRAVAQRCPNPPMINYISLGGQHQGVYGLPHCFFPPHTTCDYIRKLLNIGAYWSWVQNALVQAEYWHDPLNEEKYGQKSVFIAEINNERFQNNSYKANLLQLQAMVLVKFEYDTMVEPHETSWFGFYTPGQAVEITPLNQSKLYQEDRLGLKQLDESGRLHLLSVKGDHLQFTEDWFLEAIIRPYLSS